VEQVHSSRFGESRLLEVRAKAERPCKNLCHDRDHHEDRNQEEADFESENLGDQGCPSKNMCQWFAWGDRGRLASNAILEGSPVVRGGPFVFGVMPRTFLLDLARLV
jgi:hypothetical protein